MKRTMKNVILMTGAVTASLARASALTPKLEPRQIEAVAAVLVMEAGGEGRRGMEAVCEVIRNRAELHETTVVKIVADPWQFSCLNGTTIDKLVARAMRSKAWPIACEVAAGAETHRTRGATHYYAKTMKTPPAWARAFKPCAVVGRHKFFKIAKVRL